MVNIPAYSLVYYQNGSEVLASRVIVGRPDRKTPMMSSALNNVVVNPPWNVPPTLARKDILPKVWNDPGYGTPWLYGDARLEQQRGDRPLYGRLVNHYRV